MEAVELMKLVTEHGLHPIPVRMPSDADESDRVARFQGTLDEFWVAAKALDAKVVFIEVLKMDESDFERDASEEDVPRGNGSEDDEEDVIALEKVVPGIAKYRKYIGKDCSFILVTKGGAAEIGMMLTEDWWDEFLEEADKAVAVWAEKQNEKFGEQEAEEEKQQGEMLRTLRGLISDKEFCRLRTLRAMMEYAIDKHPELAELDEFVYKPELQTLKAKIEAKGLNRKS